MKHGRSNDAPLLDEDTQSDTTMPSSLVTECDDARSLQKITGKSSLVEWVDETIGDTHIGKRKQNTMKKKGKGKKNKTEWLQAMKKLLIRKEAQNTKNPT
jgi:hypothetical protein